MRTEWCYRLPSGSNRNMFSVKQRMLKENFTVPIYFLDERREVWKRDNIAMFGKPSIEDSVEF
jgi:hypothetical protein